MKNSWYRPGDWKLPDWWTQGVPVREGSKVTYQETVNFYNSTFMREVIGHKGGIKTLPS